MARDQELLETASQPTLRLYGWLAPTVSVGYSQRWEPPQGPWVRRPTGGRALLHEPDEITYAVILPEAGEVRVDEAFCFLTGSLREALGALGVPVTCSPSRLSGGGSPSCLACLQRGELVAQGAKLVGSAQARRAGRLLQHGAIPFAPSQARHEQLFGPLGKVLGVRDLGSSFTPDELAEAWARALRIRWG